MLYIYRSVVLSFVSLAVSLPAGCIIPFPSSTSAYGVAESCISLFKKKNDFYLVHSCNIKSAIMVTATIHSVHLYLDGTFNILQ